MKDLLIKWAELEPTLCKFLYDGVVLLMNGEWTFIYTTPFDADMYIQYTVQQAIVARGWDYRLEAYTMEGQRQYAAWVYPGGQALGQAPEAEALLAAYVGALEA